MPKSAREMMTDLYAGVDLSKVVQGMLDVMHEVRHESIQLRHLV